MNVNIVLYKKIKKKKLFKELIYKIFLVHAYYILLKFN